MRKIIPFCMLIFLISCKEKKEKNTSKKENKPLASFIIEKSKLDFSLDKDEDISTYTNIQVINDSIISYTNKDNYSITLFNLNTNKRQQKLFFKKKGPNGLENAFRYNLIKNRDTILFLNKFSNQLIFSDYKGNIFSKIKYKDNDEISPMVTTESPLILTKDNLIIPIACPTIGRTFVKSSSIPVSLLFNFKTEETSNSPLNYSKSTKNNNNPMLVYPISCYDTKNERMIYLFKQQNKIYSVDKENKLKSYGFASEFIKPYNNHFNSTDFSKLMEFYIENPNNFKIIYDEFRDVFYLFLSHGIPIKDNKGDLNNFNKKPFSIIVFDTNFTPLLEKKFEGASYEIRNVFISKKGLFLSENNVESNETNQNHLKFSLIKLKLN